MTLENIANTDLEITMTKVLMPPHATFIGGTHQLTTPPDVSMVTTQAIKSKLLGKPVCTTSITFTWLPAFPCPWAIVFTPPAIPRYTFVAGAGSIIASAIKTKAAGFPVLRENDSGSCSGSWTLSVSPFTSFPCQCSAKISSAGQTKGKAQ